MQAARLKRLLQLSRTYPTEPFLAAVAQPLIYGLYGLTRLELLRPLGAAFRVGGLAGAYMGARCQRFIPQAALKGLLAVLLAGLAVRYLWPG